MSAPRVIWLQGDLENRNAETEISWCDHDADDHGTAYILKSEHDRQVIQQQARIVELHYYLSRAITTFRTIPKTVEKRARKVLATTDDLSALAEHDKQLWNEALTTGIEWQATRGHTLDADDYEHELRGLKR